MLVFTNYITPRLQYIVKTLFENITEEISLETDSEKFLLYDGIKINYAAQKNFFQ